MLYFQQDAPVEVSRLFHEKLMRAFKKFVYVDGGKTPGVVGRVTEYLIRYEVQDRG